ncbi:hypothetical protein EVJ58_g5164 [Rhodofomes roseus]|uniref:Uncharacterized protein n=1 Tax=Rhodofomes roseus TaxID=34475 RepID=A0A4Y9YF09_9APHY|nr:hypothetical protein EVJ58_g5164 [Rhodofomes roseus]
MVPESFSVNWHASEKHSYTGFEPPSANVELKKTPLLPSVVSAALPPAISLDGVAYTLMESSVKELQASLVPGTSLTLVFTTPGTTASFPSNNFVLAALPFLPRSGFKQTSQKQVHPTNQHGPWAPAPLFSSLPQILQLLTAGPNPLVVNSIVNISEAYASSLHAYVHALEEDRVATERFVQQHGVAPLAGGTILC